MKIAYFGYDPLFSCLETLLNQGHQIAVIYTGENSLYSHKVTQFAKKNTIELQFGVPNQEDMHQLVSQGIELFFSAEYPHKIPIPESLKYAINVHPTLLPEGRGMTPLPHVILKNGQAAGVTFHTLSQEYDQGDIVIQKAIEVSDSETFDSLSAKVASLSCELLNILLPDFDKHYRHATKQHKGSHWPTITKQQQTLQWKSTTRELLTTLRAFGSLGTYANIAGEVYIIVCQASGEMVKGRNYQHHFNAGDIIKHSQQHLVVATIDGELTIPKSALINPNSG